MRKLFFISLAGFFLLSFLILYFSPGSIQALKESLNSADLLFPFSIYESLFEGTGRPDWVFGGYTPFLDLITGFLFWAVTRNIQLTFTLFAVFQPVIVTISLLYLSSSLVGKNWKLFSFVAIFSIFPILIFSTGHLQFLYALFSWYLHISTACLALIGLGLLIRYTIILPSTKKIFQLDLAWLFVITGIAVLSDPIYLAQFVVPAITLLVILVILGTVPFYRGVIAGLVVLYSTAAGLALYQLPRVWGSDRIVLYGSYMLPVVERVIENWPLLIYNTSIALEGRGWIAAICGIFYMLCITSVFSLAWQRQKSTPGRIRKKLLVIFLFLPIQMVVTVGSSLIANEPSERYFLPVLLFSLFWGWPFLLIRFPGWIKWLSMKRAAAAGLVLTGVLSFLLVKNFLSTPASLRQNLAEYYPDFIQCMDANTSRLDLHRGIAHYWQARQVSLLSKNNLVIVQVYPDLTPLRILNNSEGYQGNFDFVIIDNNPPLGNWIDRELVLQRFGEPATRFTCADSDILVYNRRNDTSFRDQFISPASSEK